MRLLIVVLALLVAAGARAGAQPLESPSDAMPAHLVYQRGLPIPMPGNPGHFWGQTDAGVMRPMLLEGTPIPGYSYQNIPGSRPLYLRGVPIPAPDYPGFIFAQMVDGSVGLMREAP